MKLVSAFLSIAGVTFLIACKWKPTLVTAKTNKSLLWEISGNGLKRPSYLLGTMHMMCAEDAAISATTHKVLDKISVVYLEVDLDNAAELLGGAMQDFQNAHSLAEVLPASDYDRVRTFFENNLPYIPFNVLERQHPLMLSSSLYELLLTCEKKNGVDVLLVEEAYKRKKEVKGLETVAFQASIIQSISYDEQAHELVKVIDNLPRHKAILDKMLDVYRRQDIEQLLQLATAEETGAAGYSDVLLHKRNDNWAEQIAKLVYETSALYAVGAGHLGGETGVLKLLQQKGFTLRPLQN